MEICLNERDVSIVEEYSKHSLCAYLEKLVLSIYVFISVHCGEFIFENNHCGTLSVPQCTLLITLSSFHLHLEN